MNYLKIVTFVFCVFHISSAKGQIGIKLGMHSFDVSASKDILLGDQTLSFKSSEIRFHGGIYGRLNLASYFLESRIMMHSNKVNYVLDDSGGTIVSESFNNIDIPILVGLDLLFMDVFFGPVAHFHIDSVSDLVDFDGYQSQYDTATYGWRAGGGLNIKNVSVTLEYEGNFSSFGNHITFAGQKFNFGNRPSRLLLTLGFSIF